jgi:hypothetical protein
MTLEELTAQRDALLAARYRGLRTVEIGRRVTMPPTPMAATLSDLERIALAESCQSSLFRTACGRRRGVLRREQLPQMTLDACCGAQ